MLSRKLKSCGGASLTVALLLFMVCAVVGIVVLTAATTAGGRAKDLTEVDRSYYNVASAVSLLSKELCGEDREIKIYRTKEETTVEGEDSPHIDYKTTIGKEVIDVQNKELGQLFGDIPDGRSFLTWMAVCLLFDGDGLADSNPNMYCNTPDAMGYCFDDGALVDGIVTQGSFVLAHPAAVGLPGIECRYTLKKDGVLLLEVTDNTPVLGLKNYTLTLKLRPEFKDTGILKNSDKGLSQRTSAVTWKVDSVS